MAEPDATRGPRSETGDHKKEEAATQEADREHLEWQLRRVLLYIRRGKLSVLIMASGNDEGKEPVTPEKTACEILCGAALTQGQVDVIPAKEQNDNDRTWELEVLQTMDGSAFRGTVDKAMERDWLRYIVNLARGHASAKDAPVHKQIVAAAHNGASMPVERRSHPGLAPVTNHHNHHVARAPQLRHPATKPIRTFYNSLRNCEEAVHSMRIECDPRDLMRWAHELPMSFVRGCPQRSRVFMPSPHFPHAAEMYPHQQLPPPLMRARGIITLIEFAEHNFVAVLFDLRGMPVSTSKVNRGPSNTFNMFIEELKSMRWFDLEPGSLLLAGPTRHLVPRGAEECVARFTEAWEDYVCEPVFAATAAVNAFVATQRISIPVTVRSDAYNAFKLLLLLVGYYMGQFAGVWGFPRPRGQ
uniref:Uncharacterized protein n=1 Tax=Neobodo designis TaxID=312471 RepID=A0A7S1LE33_NEODS